MDTSTRPATPKWGLSSLFGWRNVGLAGLLFAFASFCLSVLIEESKTSAGFPLVALGAMTCVLSLVASPMTHGVGPRSRSGYSLWQPFYGGGWFVLLQSIGWICYGGAMLLGIMFFYHSAVLDLMPVNGVITLIGGLGFVSQVCIMFSFLFFKASQDQQPAETAAEDITDVAPQHSIESWNTLAVFTLLLAIVPCSVFFVSDIRAYLPHLFHLAATDYVFGMLALLAAAPLTHALVGRKKFEGTSGGTGYNVWQPFQGGSTFVFLQACGWVFYALAVILALTAVFHVYAQGREPVHGVLAVTGGAGLLAQVLVLASLGFFDGSDALNSSFTLTLNKSGHPNDDGLDGYRSFEKPARSPLDGAWRSIGTHTLFLSGASCMLFLLVELHANHDEVPEWLAAMDIIGMIVRVAGITIEPAKISLQLGVTAAILLFAAAPLTHGVAGPRMAERKKIGEPVPYSFYQPFVGGPIFVSLQALAWLLYSATMLGAIYAFYTLAQGVPVRGMLSYIGLGGFTAQALVLASLFWWQRTVGIRQGMQSQNPTVRAEAVRRDMLGVREGLRVLGQDLTAFLTPAFFFNVPILICWLAIAVMWVMGSHYFMVLGFFFALLSGVDFLFFMVCVVALILATPGSLILLGLSLMYWRTYKNLPSQTGALQSEWVRGQAWLWDNCARYFSAKVVGHEKLDPGKTYLIGFHPHGIYPLTCAWIGLCSAFRSRHPGVNFDMGVASIVFRVPLMRHVIMWLGGREVSRLSINNALATGRSVLVVPGGQAEMRHTSRNAEVMVLVSKHKGFVRMALNHGAALVPLLCFGEELVLQNINAPRVQAWFCSWLGFGFPHYPYGRWYTSIPNAVPLTVAVGAPIDVPQISEPSDAEIDLWHEKYFASIRALFDEHKASAGYANSTLILKDH